MGGYTLNNIALKYVFLILSLFLVGCQSTLEGVGQEHAKEVKKWQELARYAGNELKHLGLTITTGVQINQSTEQTTYSLIRIQLNQDANHTEIDLLSPEFAEKFSCSKECQRLGLYDSNFAKQETQLTSFFFAKEGSFFEFYGRLTQLNEILAYYRASSPAILKKYLTLMLNRRQVFNSLSAFLDDLEKHVTEDKLIAFTKSGFVSPVTDRASSTFLHDVTANFPIDDEDVSDLSFPDDNWNVIPGHDWSVMPDDNWVSNTLYTKHESWEQAKKNNIQVGSIVCTFSDNSFGVVEELKVNEVTLKIIAQARVMIDGMKIYPRSGHLFSAVDSFYFVKGSLKDTYSRSDIAACNIEHLKRGRSEKSIKSIDK
jgi:hypothetical protein